MKAAIALLVLATLVAPVSAAERQPRLLHADMLIGAGHEGRPQSCSLFPKRPCNLGAQGEREWTPIVADEATRVLRAHGVSVARVPADFLDRYAVRDAVFIHFDGAEPACTTGASIGYRPQSASLAAAWKAAYARVWPFRFMPDNYTDNLSGYYGFRSVDASDGALIVELGEISCPAQHAWLETRLREEGDRIARFLLERLHGTTPGKRS